MADCLLWCGATGKPRAPKKEQVRIRSHRRYTDRERILIVAMIDQGLSYSALARLLHMSVVSVYTIYKRYVADGRQFIKRRSGPQRKTYDADVEAHVTSRAFMQKWCHLSLARRALVTNHQLRLEGPDKLDRFDLRRIYLAQGIKPVYPQISKQNAFDDADKARRQRELEVMAIKLASYQMAGHSLIFVDETSTNLWVQAQHKARVWQRPDQRIEIVQPTNRHKSQTLIGGLGWVLKDKAYVRFATKTNTVEFVAFLEHLGEHVEADAPRPLYLVLDNHKAHHSFAAQWKMQELGMQPLYLPSCASKYSSVERLWSCMKTHLVRILGQTLLRVGKRKMDMADLRAACELAFADVSITARENLVFSNRADLLAVLETIRVRDLGYPAGLPGLSGVELIDPEAEGVAPATVCAPDMPASDPARPDDPVPERRD